MSMDWSKWRGIMAVDPGGTTGVVSGIVPRGGSVKGILKRTRSRSAEQIKAAELRAGTTWSADLSVALALAERWEAFAKNCLKLGIHPELVVEDFQLRQRNVDLMPVNVRSALEGVLWMAGRVEADLRAGDAFEPGAVNRRFGGVPGMEFAWAPIYQQPSEAKGYGTDARLRQWGLWERGMPHARDAWRHFGFRVLKGRVG